MGFCVNISAPQDSFLQDIGNPGFHLGSRIALTIKRGSSGFFYNCDCIPRHIPGVPLTTSVLASGKGIARPWKLVYYRAKKMFDVNNYKGR